MTWYAADVQEAVNRRMQCNYAPKTIFYGSSTIRLWTSLEDDFGDHSPVNLGFGGSTLAACVWFFDHIVAPLTQPKRLIFYAGDNDLGDGRHPEEVLLFYRQFIATLRKRFNELPCYFLSIKPSVARMQIIDEIMYTNHLIREEIANNAGNEFFVNTFDSMLDKASRPRKSLFTSDGLHLNKKGYHVLKEAIYSNGVFAV